MFIIIINESYRSRSCREPGLIVLALLSSLSFPVSLMKMNHASEQVKHKHKHTNAKKQTENIQLDRSCVLIVCHLVWLYICCEVNIPHVLTWNAEHVKSAIVTVSSCFFRILFIIITKLYIFRQERFNIA